MAASTTSKVGVGLRADRAVDSFVALALDWFSPTLVGQVVIAVQAVGVAAFAALRYVGMRR